MDYTKEIEGKLAHDPYFLNLKMKPPRPLPVVDDDDDVSVSSSTPCHKTQHFAPGRPPCCFPRQVWVPGPVIVGAGPSGLAVAACLKRLGIPRLILERSSCIASLWQLNTYDRLRLHLPKQFCELPYFPFPSDFPTYPTKQHFIAYLEAYMKHFSLKPVFNRTVVRVEFDKRLGLWRVVVTDGGGGGGKGVEMGEMVEYLSRWVIVASGENAEPVMPEIEGLDHFEGKVVHTSSYKSGEEFMGKRVLVVGCGNSGMEVSLDLCNHNARPALVVRDSVHILPQEMLGTSTFGLSMWLLKWFPVCLVDRLLLFISRIMLGDIGKLGLNRPSAGPLQLKSTTGKTPVLDVGTLAEIRSGNIEVFPGINRIVQRGAQFVDGRFENFDAIILATGYKSNVSSWLKRSNMYSVDDVCPSKPFPDGWKGENGLYAVGFTNRGILGLSFDARRIADDIQATWRINEKWFMFCP